jgi:glycerol-3-phosphate dehydrogenase
MANETLQSFGTNTTGVVRKPSHPMNRETFLQRITARTEPWDIAVVGGGATGVGIAVDAAARGYAVVLFEQSDFGKGTSSRSTKLVHGGVRYLQQGNISLVMEALKERGLLLQNAPHIVHDLEFIVPNYGWETPFYGIGMKVYDLLAGKYGFGPSQLLSREATLERIPTLSQDGLRGGVMYHDGQFDDTRLAGKSRADSGRPGWRAAELHDSDGPHEGRRRLLERPHFPRRGDRHGPHRRRAFGNQRHRPLLRRAAPPG